MARGFRAVCCTPTSCIGETAMPGPTFGRIAKMKVTVFWVKSLQHNDLKIKRCVGLFLGEIAYTTTVSSCCAVEASPKP